MDEQDQFNKAYRNRLLLNTFVACLYIGIFGFALLAIVAFFEGNFVGMLASALLAVACFFLWAVVHNWALRYPK